MNKIVKLAKLNGGGNNKRNSYIDCFKIFLMVMIVAHHGIVHGLGFENIQTATMNNQFGLIHFEVNAFLVIAVNCFFWISGYFRIKRRISRAIELIIETMVYIFVLNVLLYITGNISIVNFLDILRIIKRVLFFYQGYWFLTAYLILFIISPYLNKMVDALSHDEKKEALIVLLLINSVCGFVLKISSLDNGYTVVQGIYMYLVGSLCRTDDIQNFFRKKEKILIVLFAIFGLLNGLVAYIFSLKGYNEVAWRMFSYNNPVIVFMAIVACLSVVHCSRSSKVCDKLGKLCKYSLAAYLLTDYPLIRKIVFSPLKYLNSISNFEMILFIFLYAIMLTFVCMGIDSIRKCLYNYIENKLNI